MKLLYITNGITGAGGLERVLSVKASALADRFGYEVHIVTLNEDKKKTFFRFSDKIFFQSISVSGNSVHYFFKYRNGIQRVVTEVQPDVISVCDDGLKGFFLPYIIRTEAKWIYESHASIFLVNSGKGISAITKWQHQLKQILGKRFSMIVLLTESNRKEWKLTNTVVIPNPLPIQTDSVSNLDSKRVIAVGSYSFNKGYDLLLKIWHQVQSDFPDWELNIYGKGVSENLQPIIEIINLNQINCHGTDPDIKKKYLESSVLVLSSRSEGFGMVIIEAMSCGLPVVSFDCPHGPGDIIENNKNGFLIEREDIGEFAEKLKLLLSNSERRNQMGEMARIVSQKYDQTIIIKQWDILFNKLLS